jgi:hypothetical protein
MLESILVLILAACGQGQVILENFNMSGLSGWESGTHSEVSQVTSPVYEGTGALKWTFTDTSEAWDNIIWKSSYTPMDLSSSTGITFRFAEDAANPSTDFGKRIYYDIYVMDSGGNISRTQGGNAIGSIQLTKSISYRIITIDITGITNRSKVCGIAFWVDGTLFTDSGVHNWYIDSIKLVPSDGVFENFDMTALSGWYALSDSTVSRVSLPVYEGNGAMKWTYRDSDQAWTNQIGNESYTPIDLSLYSAVTFEFAEDAANPSTDVGRQIYYDLSIMDDEGNITRSHGGNALGSILLSKNTSYRKITIDLNGITDRSKVCGIAFWVDGTSFTDSSVHNWYIDSFSYVLQLDSALMSDAYVSMGKSVVERFLGRLRTGGPDGDQSEEWSELQVQELNWVSGQMSQRIALLNSSPTSIWAFPENPASYLMGYGHFSQVVEDLPVLRNYGVTLIQQECGPTDMNSDGSLTADALSAQTILNTAAANGVKEDLLLSPHYFPDWAIAQAPEITSIEKVGFMGYNIDHPLAREVISDWLNAFVPTVKDKSALQSFCLSNEPVYANSGRDSYGRSSWITYLTTKHQTIAVLNTLYGTSYTSFSDVPVPATGMPIGTNACRAYYDWVVFNQEHFADWHRWMNDIVKTIAPNVPTHSKVMPYIFTQSKIHYGMDPELICGITDLAGCDCWANVTSSGDYCYSWQLQEVWYDLLYSFKHQPVFNSENHLINNDSPAESIAPGHTRSVLWQGALHHMEATAIWLWEEPSCSDFMGSIYLRPANMYSASQAMMDMQRLATKVNAINNDSPKVALLYSIPSIFWQSDYGGSVLFNAYTALSLSGLPVTFVSERQLISGQVPDVDWIILPHATHVTAGAVSGLKTFVEQGGKVIMIGSNNLKYNEYHQTRTIPSVLSQSTTLSVAGAESLATSLRSVLTAGGVSMVRLSNATTGVTAWGIEYRVVSYRGSTLVPMINFLRTSQTVSINLEGAAVDLLSGQTVNLHQIVLEPMTPVLLQVGQEDEAIPGDANGDDVVDVGDLGILAANYGGSGKTWEQGDFNNDGIVDVGDLGILAAHYGTSSQSSLSFEADYAKVFGTTAESVTSEDDTDSSLCSSLGLSLIAGLTFMGLMLVKREV